jgi:hypothetical protein
MSESGHVEMGFEVLKWDLDMLKWDLEVLKWDLDVRR